MRIEVKLNNETGKNELHIIQPNIQYTEKGKLKALGGCWVNGDQLECYGWDNEDMLWIFNKVDADPEGIPVVQYYCFNPLKNDYGWVTEDQVKFEMDSLFGEPYRVKKV